MHVRNIVVELWIRVVDLWIRVNKVILFYVRDISANPRPHITGVRLGKIWAKNDLKYAQTVLNIVWTSS